MAGAALPAQATIVVAADRDDDDLDGKPDADSPRLSAFAKTSLFSLDSRFWGAKLRADSGSDHVRVMSANGAVVPFGNVVPKSALLQGVSVGVTHLVLLRGGKEEAITVDVVGLGFRDGANEDLDLARDRASLERTPPERAPASPEATYDDGDALRARFEIPADGAMAVDAAALSVESISASGASIDKLDAVTFDHVPCGAGKACFVTAPIRLVVDDVDRTLPLVERRSVRAEVGGAVVLRYAGAEQSIRIEGPRNTSLGAIPRYRASVRPFVVRVTAKGAPAVGGNEQGAALAVRQELALASATWGQCGITFGKTDAIDVKIIDPPPPFLVSFGDDLGIAASGGSVKVKIDGKLVSSEIQPGSSPLGAARAFAAAAAHAGFSAAVSPNVRIVPAAGSSVDVLVKHDGALAHVTPASGTHASDDASMVVRIGSVDLSDGLYHFGDMDSMSGTLEERTLVKSIDDGDPSTIDVVFVPSFTGGDRIGESFIQNDTSSIRDLVILDRAGVRARRMSSTLAHEAGHVLMDAPGHPDDYGLDTPTRLMDSDGADASPFGPRRLAIDECVRAVKEAGPKARVPLLVPWPLTPLKIAR